MRSSMSTPNGRSLRLALCLVLVSCKEERPPAPEADPAAPSAEQAAGPVWLDPTRDAFVLTHAGERGTFADSKSVDAVPEPARGLVRVTLLDGPRPPPDRVFVCNLEKPEPDGRFRLQDVARDMFEELALGQGLSSAVELPEGLEPPKAAPRSDGIVVYKTDWCGVCKKLTAYLDRKGVAYEAKDVEKDPKAAAELKAKSAAAGLETGSVPVVDVRGELMVGFDRARLEKLLAG